MDGENPTRRYKWFRPRQAQSADDVVGADNFAAIGLFNNSTGPHVLVVRHLTLWSPDSILDAFCGNFNGKLSNIVQGRTPVISNSPLLDGVLYDDDLTAFPTYVQGIAFHAPQDQLVWWQHDFPIAVIEPGWSFVVAIDTQAKTLGASFMWEAITIDELDFIY